MKSGTASQLALSSGDTKLIIIGLLVLAGIVVLSPIALAWLYRSEELIAEDAAGKQIKISFFQIPFITWFMIHIYVPMLGILAVVGLGFGHVLDTPTVAAILSGLFGYVLGNAGSHAAQQTNKPSPPKGTDAKQ